MTFAPARLSSVLRPILVQMSSARQPFCSASLAPTVVNNVRLGRFELPIEGHMAELQYRIKGSVIHLDHTEVPEALEGRGLGKILAKVCLLEPIVYFNSIPPNYPVL